MPASGAGRWRPWCRGTYIPSVCWSPGGSLLACGTLSGEIRIHDSGDFHLVGLLAGHRGRVAALAWSPDGKRLASGGNDQTVRLWPLDGSPGSVLKGHTGPVTNVAWSPDSRRLASGSADTTVRLWGADGTTGPVLSTQGYVFALAWSPDGTRLASGGGDRTLRLWDADGKAEPALRLSDNNSTVAFRGAKGDSKLDALRGHDQPIRGLAWSPDGTQIVSSSFDGMVRFWTSDGAAGPVFQASEGSCQALTWGAGGERLASARTLVGGKTPIRLWRRTGGSEPALSGHDHGIMCLAWSSDGERLVSCDRDGMVRLWASDGTPGAVAAGNNVGVESVAWIQNDQALAASIMDQTTRAFESDGTPLWRLDKATHRLAWSESTRRLAFVAWGGDVGTIDGDGTLGPVLGVNPGNAAVAWDPKGERMAAGGGDRTVRLWSSDGTQEAELHGHTEAIVCVAWNPAGRWIATGGYDRSVRLWSSDGRPGPVFDGAKCTILALAWHPDAAQLAMGCYDGTVRLWNPEGAVGPVLRGHAGMVRAVAWSPDGKRLLSGGEDTLVQLWDESRRPGQVFHGDGAEIASIAWSSRNHQIAVASLGGTIRIWDAETTSPRRVILLLRSGISVTFSAAGEILQGDPAVIENLLLYRVETPSGRFELLKPSAFRQRIAGSSRGVAH